MKYFLIALVGFIPFLSSAATFHYVNTQGITDSIEAASAQAALSDAPNIASNSGVALDEGLIEDGTPVYPSSVVAAGGQLPGRSELYHYVTAQGITDSVTAVSAQAALDGAPNIAANSGVALDEGLIEDGMVVESVAQ